MQAPQEIKDLFSEYQTQIDSELEKVFDNTPGLPMYDHLAYFMGFKNEKLEPKITYAGKRFRSALMLMLGDWYGEKELVMPYAVALELYHNFTLIHDDVVDGDTMRRGRPTVWKLFGHDHAINDGDAQLLMVAQFLAAAGAKDRSRAQMFLLEQFLKVVEGQHRDFTLTEAKLGDEVVTEEDYRLMIHQKTADLIIAATVGAGIVAGVDNDELEKLKVYGEKLGMAYQVCDDVISIWTEGAKTGKRDYGDIIEKKKTLPVLYAYERMDSESKGKLLDIYNREETLSTDQCEQVIDLLNQTDVASVMQSEIDEYAKDAKSAAASLSLPNECKEKLENIVDTLLPKV